ncbi:hypothetical protein V8C35DRAFT_324580 [Trichoderma chlorosporum]
MLPFLNQSNGNITSNWRSFSDKSGNFQRPPAVLREKVSKEPGAKYHLYVSYACPWAHRISIARKLEGLDNIIPFTSIQKVIVNKESSEILRMFGTEFDDIIDEKYRNVRAVTDPFTALVKSEKHLAPTEGPYWFGKDITEVDIMLYVTLIRFDVVYVQHFKYNIRDIRSGYPCLHKWLRNLYWNVPAFKKKPLR